MTKQLKEPVRMVFDADPDLTVAIDTMRRRFGQTRKGFVNGVMREIFRLPNPVATWVDQAKAT